MRRSAFAAGRARGVWLGSDDAVTFFRARWLRAIGRSFFSVGSEAVAATQLGSFLTEHFRRDDPSPVFLQWDGHSVTIAGTVESAGKLMNTKLLVMAPQAEAETYKRPNAVRLKNFQRDFDAFEVAFLLSRDGTLALAQEELEASKDINKDV